MAHFSVVGDIVFLTGRARATVGNVHGHVADVADVGAVGWVAWNAFVGVARMGHHGDDGGEVDGVDTTIVVSAFIGGDHASALFILGQVRLGFEHPCHERIVGFADAGSSRTLCRHVAKRRSLVHGKGGEPGATEFHASVEGQFLASVVGQNGENDVFGRAAVMEFTDQFETNGFRDLDKCKASADEVGVFGRSHAPGQRVGCAAHAGVRIGGLDKIANFNELFTSHLVADAGRDAVDGGVIPYTRVLLEGHLEVAQRLHFVHEGNKLRVVLSVEQVVFEHREFTRVG